MLFLILIFNPAWCQSEYHIDSTLIDSSSIKIKYLVPDFFSKYRSDPDFNYDFATIQKREGLLGDLLNWIIEKTNLTQKHYKTLSIIFKILFWLIIAAILLFAFTRIKFYKYFYTKEEAPQKEFRIEQANADVVDLEAEIRRELENKNYRKALRYQFLYTLSKLDENGIISWSGEKTNIDYLSEISKNNSDYVHAFQELLNAYNAVWYGNYTINEEEYSGLSRSFIILSYAQR